MAFKNLVLCVNGQAALFLNYSVGLHWYILVFCLFLTLLKICHYLYYYREEFKKNKKAKEGDFSVHSASHLDWSHPVKSKDTCNIVFLLAEHFKYKCTHKTKKVPNYF